MHIGKILTLSGLLTLAFCFSVFAQVDSLRAPVNVSSDSDNQINIYLDPTAGELNFEELDSIMKQLYTTLNNLEPVSDIYGHSFFKADSLKVFKPGDIVKVPDSYALGSGDEIAVAIFGVSQMDAIITVDNAGFVSLGQDLPRVNVKGLNWGAAKELLRKRYSIYFRFRDAQFAASVVKPRSLSVNVIGEVEQPGTYLLEATNTAWHAIVAAGGTTDIGSVRNIEVVTSAGTKRLDVYQLLSDPNVQSEFYLEDNAIIRVAPLGELVSLSGAVLRPMKYELYGTEDINDVINYAGGLLANAVQEVVQIKRFTNDRIQLVDLNIRELRSKKQSFTMKNGDDAHIAFVPDIGSDVVYVEGAVMLPGSYDINSTRRISDLVNKSRLKREAQRDVALLVRLNPDSTFRLVEIDLAKALHDISSAENIELQDQDKLVVNDLKDLVDKSIIKVSGAVRKAIEYPFDINADISLAQAIQLAGGLDPEAKSIGYILRSDPTNRSNKKYVEVDLRSAIVDMRGDANISLQPWDEVVVIRTSSLTDQKKITSRGSFRIPASLDYHQDITVKELILLSGGFDAKASGQLHVYRNNLNGEISVISLKVNDDFEILEGPQDFQFVADDEVVALNYENYEQTSFVEIQGEVKTAGLYAITSDNQTVRSIVEKAGGLTSEAHSSGVYIMRVENPEEDEIRRYKVPVEALGSIILSDDIIVIPKKRNSVILMLSHTRGSTVQGRSIEVPHSLGRDANWYIDNYAGGLIDKADREAIVVEQPNGAMERSTKKFFKYRYPEPKEGSTIHIIKSRQLSASSEKSESMYPKLKDGVIINVNPNSGEIIQQDQP